MSFSKIETNETKLVFDTKEELDAAFGAFQRKTETGWRCFRTSSLFGQSVDESIKTLKERSRVHWSVVAVSGISFPFDGIPFIHAGIIQFQCHKGDDIDEKTKERRKRLSHQREEQDHIFQKRRTLVQSTKKIGCPAKVFMSRVIKFPKYKVDVALDGKRPERKMRAAAAQLREDLKQGKDTEPIEEFVLKLPDVSVHQCHVVEGGVNVALDVKWPKRKRRAAARQLKEDLQQEKDAEPIQEFVHNLTDSFAPQCLVEEGEVSLTQVIGQKTQPTEEILTEEIEDYEDMTILKENIKEITGTQLVFHTKEDIDVAFEDFKQATQTGWRCLKTNNLFGQSVIDSIKTLKERSRVHWSVVAVSGISFPFDGIPFIHAGIIQFQCHKGDDIDEKTKERRKMLLDEREEHNKMFRKRRNLVQSTKKIGCPAKVFMSRVIKFPKYKVDVALNGKRPERKMRAAAGQLREHLRQEKDTEPIQEFILKLPDISVHQCRVVEGEGAHLREPIAEEIVSTIE